MSSKVLTGEAGGAAEPIVWKRVAPGFGPDERGSPEAASEEKLRATETRLAELEQETARREQRALESGYRKGLAEGREQAIAQLDPVLKGFARATEEMLGQRRRMRREAEEDVVKLSLAIARRILHRELSMDPDTLLGIVKAALEKLEGREVDRIRVHPEDAPLVETQFEQLGLAERVRVAGDPHLGRGSAILDTSHGSLDASVDTQLQEIQRGLLDRIGRSA